MWEKKKIQVAGFELRVNKRKVYSYQFLVNTRKE